MFLKIIYKIVGYKRNFFLLPEVRNTENVQSLPETCTFVASLHRAQQIKYWLCIGLKYTTNINKTYKYHVSLQICTNRCSECRDISP